VSPKPVFPYPHYDSFRRTPDGPPPSGEDIDTAVTASPAPGGPERVDELGGRNTRNGYGKLSGLGFEEKRNAGWREPKGGHEDYKQTDSGNYSDRANKSVSSSSSFPQNPAPRSVPLVSSRRLFKDDACIHSIFRLPGSWVRKKEAAKKGPRQRAGIKPAKVSSVRRKKTIPAFVGRYQKHRGTTKLFPHVPVGLYHSLRWQWFDDLYEGKAVLYQRIDIGGEDPVASGRPPSARGSVDGLFTARRLNQYTFYFQVYF
jgi:hypothetical protein